MRRRMLWADALDAMGAARTVVEATWAKAENNEVLSDADLEAFMQALAPLPAEAAIAAVVTLAKFDRRLLTRPAVYKFACRYAVDIARVLKADGLPLKP